MWGGTGYVHLSGTRKSGSKPQAPLRRVNSQLDDGVQTKRQDILEQTLSHRRYPRHIKRGPLKMQPTPNLKVVDGNKGEDSENMKPEAHPLSQCEGGGEAAE